MKSLDRKLAAIHEDPSGCREFILADAKDADMAFGVTAPGPHRGRCPHPFNESEGCWKTVEDYRAQVRDVVRQGLVDIVLLSASNLERLAMEEGLFADSPVTPAARANDASDVWAVRGGRYPGGFPARDFRSATIDHIKYGRLVDDHAAPAAGADLGLYSVTFTNDLDADYAVLQAFHAFRIEAERKRFRYFLEAFNPNVDAGIPDGKVGGFLNDHIIRCLAGVTHAGRPIFLKIPYNGPGPLEELVAYDSRLVVGILGGSAGTTRDAFQLIHDARKYGARVALFGRKINLSEHPLAFIEFLRRIVEGDLGPEEAVKAYHAVLKDLKIRPNRPLRQDLQMSRSRKSYG